INLDYFRGLASGGRWGAIVERRHRASGWPQKRAVQLPLLEGNAGTKNKLVTAALVSAEHRRTGLVRLGINKAKTQPLLADIGRDLAVRHFSERLRQASDNLHLAPVKLSNAQLLRRLRHH